MPAYPKANTFEQTEPDRNRPEQLRIGGLRVTEDPFIFTRATGNHFMSWQTPDDNQWGMILIFSACRAMGGYPDVGQMLIGGGVSLFVWWTLAFVGRNVS